MKHTIVDKARILRGVPLLSEVPTEVLAELAALSLVEEHPAGAVLLRKGEPADAFYIVVDGEISAAHDGSEAFRAGAGEQFGALAVLEERPRTFTATTTTDARVLRIGGEDFLYLLEQHPGLARGVIRYLACEMRSTIGDDGRYGGNPAP